jgi:histidine triad (HIT) family protein
VSDTDCLFCKFASGAIPVDKLHDDDLCFALRDIEPKAPVHLLVISKEHVESAQTVGAEHGALLARMLQVAEGVAKSAGVAESGYRLVFNVGPDSGRTIFHLHMHVLGGHALGAMASQWG